MYYPEPVNELIEQLRLLPGVGTKTAQRLAMHLLGRPAEEVNQLARSMVNAKQNTVYCSSCFNLASDPTCSICQDPRRDHTTICVVEGPADVVAMERTHEYRGLYHVLHGAMSPVDGIGPNDLRVPELMDRLQDSEVEEIIVATNPTIEGEATALYLAKLIKPRGIRVTRIARGLPEGGDLDYVDEVTLSRSLKGRQEV